MRLNTCSNAERVADADATTAASDVAPDDGVVNDVATPDADKDKDAAEAAEAVDSDATPAEPDAPSESKLVDAADAASKEVSCKKPKKNQ